MKRNKAEISLCVPAHQADTRNRRLPTDGSINLHVGGSALFRPHTWIHTRKNKSSTWGGLPSHRSVRCSHNPVPIILCKQKVYTTLLRVHLTHLNSFQEIWLVQLMPTLYLKVEVGMLASPQWPFISVWKIKDNCVFYKLCQAHSKDLRQEAMKHTTVYKYLRCRSASGKNVSHQKSSVDPVTIASHHFDFTAEITCLCLKHVNTCVNRCHQQIENLVDIFVTALYVHDWQIGLNRTSFIIIDSSFCHGIFCEALCNFI